MLSCLSPSGIEVQISGCVKGSTKIVDIMGNEKARDKNCSGFLGLHMLPQAASL
jgi:hypothetical protein